jgi:hypothetical protein
LQHTLQLWPRCVVVGDIERRALRSLRWAPHNLVGVPVHHPPPCLLLWPSAITWLKGGATLGCALPACAEEDPSSTILPLLFFLAGTRSPSSNQSSLPWIKSLSLASRRSRFTMAKRKPPLSSPLIYLPSRKYSMPREVPRKRCSGFLVIPGHREKDNIER